MLQPELRTTRLILRPPELRDAEHMFTRWASDAEVTRFLAWETHTHQEQSVETVRRCVADWVEGTRCFPRVITTLDEPGVPVGMTDVILDGTSAEVGYVLMRSCWGLGYASEALQAIVDELIALPEIWRVQAITDAENIGSVRVLGRVGMVHEGRLRRHLVRPAMGNIPRDSLIFSIVRS